MCRRYLKDSDSADGVTLRGRHKDEHFLLLAVLQVGLDLLEESFVLMGFLEHASAAAAWLPVLTTPSASPGCSLDECIMPAPPTTQEHLHAIKTQP